MTNRWKSLLLALGVGAFWLALVSIPLPGIGGPYRGTDWTRVFDPATRMVMEGGVPYGVVDAASHPIHLYALLGWVEFVSPSLSYTLWTLLTIAFTLFALHTLGETDPAPIILSLTSPWFLLVVVLGQVTALEVMGLALAIQALRQGCMLRAGLAYLALTAVPPNTLLVAGWLAFRRSFLIVGLGLGFPLLLGTLVIWGDWITPYLGVFQKSAQANAAINLSLWGISPWLGAGMLVAVAAVGVAVKKHLQEAPAEVQVLFILASTLLVSPYLLGHRLFPVYVLATGLLTRKGGHGALALYLASWGLFLAHDLSGEGLFLFALAPLAYVLSLWEVYQTSRAPQEEYREPMSKQLRV
jgi:hypothetical protein